jgi:hypothetical protein
LGQHGASLAKGCEQGKASCIDAQTNSNIEIEIRCDGGQCQINGSGVRVKQF